MLPQHNQILIFVVTEGRQDSNLNESSNISEKNSLTISLKLFFFLCFCTSFILSFSLSLWFLAVLVTNSLGSHFAFTKVNGIDSSKSKESLSTSCCKKAIIWWLGVSIWRKEKGESWRGGNCWLLWSMSKSVLCE